LDGSMSLLNAEDSVSSSSGLQGGKGAVKGKGTLKGKGKCTGKGKGATKAKGNRPGTAVDPTSSLRIPILMSRRRDTIFETPISRTVLVNSFESLKNVCLTDTGRRLLQPRSFMGHTLRFMQYLSRPDGVNETAAQSTLYPVLSPVLFQAAARTKAWCRMINVAKVIWSLGFCLAPLCGAGLNFVFHDKEQIRSLTIVYCIFVITVWMPLSVAFTCLFMRRLSNNVNRQADARLRTLVLLANASTQSTFHFLYKRYETQFNRCTSHTQQQTSQQQTVATATNDDYQEPLLRRDVERSLTEEEEEEDPALRLSVDFWTWQHVDERLPGVQCLSQDWLSGVQCLWQYCVLRRAFPPKYLALENGHWSIRMDPTLWYAKKKNIVLSPNGGAFVPYQFWLHHFFKTLAGAISFPFIMLYYVYTILYIDEMQPQPDDDRGKVRRRSAKAVLLYLVYTFCASLVVAVADSQYLFQRSWIVLGSPVLFGAYLTANHMEHVMFMRSAQQVSVYLDSTLFDQPDAVQSDTTNTRDAREGWLGKFQHLGFVNVALSKELTDTFHLCGVDQYDGENEPATRILKVFDFLQIIKYARLDFCLERLNIEVNVSSLTFFLILIISIGFLLPANHDFMDCEAATFILDIPYRGHVEGNNTSDQKNVTAGLEGALHCVQFWGVDSFLVVWGLMGIVAAILSYLKSALEFNKIFAQDVFTFLDSWVEKVRWLQWMSWETATVDGEHAAD